MYLAFCFSNNKHQLQQQQHSRTLRRQSRPTRESRREMQRQALTCFFFSSSLASSSLYFIRARAKNSSEFPPFAFSLFFFSFFLFSIIVEFVIPSVGRSDPSIGIHRVSISGARCLIHIQTVAATTWHLSVARYNGATYVFV